MWYWLTRGADESGRAKAEAALHKPLPGRTERVSAGSLAYERNLFERSLKGQTG